MAQELINPNSLMGYANMVSGLQGLYHNQANQTYVVSAEYLERQQKRERAALRNRLADKDTRMNRRLARHRKALWQRRGLEALAAFLTLTVTPLAVVVIALCWRAALGAVLG